jgi:glutathione S-transferase
VTLNGKVPPILETVNPTCELPFLTDKMLALFDYNSIVLYLQERFPAAEYLPEHPKLRAQIRQICAYMDSFATVGDGGMFQHGTGWWPQKVIDEIDALLEPRSTWLLGEEYSLADLYATTLLHRMLTHDVRVTTKMRCYMDRLFARPSFERSL